VFPETNHVHRQKENDALTLSHRYLAVVIGGVKNVHYKAVAKDITESVMETKATKGVPATYWKQEEQVRRLEDAFEKWAKKGNVWSAAAVKVRCWIVFQTTAQIQLQVHAEQMRHVRRGCLVRTRHDIPADGSRVEASHKGWNSLQRSFASGIEMFNALAHDFVLRRNVRIASARDKQVPFIESTHGSHHVRLTHHIAVLWNQVMKKEELENARIRGFPGAKDLNGKLQRLPEMPTCDSRESFGLVTSRYVETFGGLIDIGEDLHPNAQFVSATVDEQLDVELDAFFQDLDIDPALHAIPLEPMSSSAAVSPTNVSNLAISIWDDVSYKLQETTSITPDSLSKTTANDGSGTTTSVTPDSQLKSIAKEVSGRSAPAETCKLIVY
jgi:hypothetical protein